MNQELTTGNARDEALNNDRRGWFIGAFMSKNDGLKCTDDVEVKWGVHPVGEVRESPAASDLATTVSILIEGEFFLDFPDLGRSVTLQQAGDYVIWAPGVSHSWKAVEASTILTVRWPSAVNERASNTNDN